MIMLYDEIRLVTDNILSIFYKRYREKMEFEKESATEVEHLEEVFHVRQEGIINLMDSIQKIEVSSDSANLTSSYLLIVSRTIEAAAIDICAKIDAIFSKKDTATSRFGRVAWDGKSFVQCLDGLRKAITFLKIQSDQMHGNTLSNQLELRNRFVGRGLKFIATFIIENPTIVDDEKHPEDFGKIIGCFKFSELLKLSDASEINQYMCVLHSTLAAVGEVIGAFSGVSGPTKSLLEGGHDLVSLFSPPKDKITYGKRAELIKGVFSPECFGEIELFQVKHAAQSKYAFTS